MKEVSQYSMSVRRVVHSCASKTYGRYFGEHSHDADSPFRPLLSGLTAICWTMQVFQCHVHDKICGRLSISGYCLIVASKKVGPPFLVLSIPNVINVVCNIQQLFPLPHCICWYPHLSCDLPLDPTASTRICVNSYSRRHRA